MPPLPADAHCTRCGSYHLIMQPQGSVCGRCGNTAPLQPRPRTLPRWLFWRWYLGTFVNTPCYVHWSMLLSIPVVLLGILPLPFLSILLVSIVIHEVAHASACRLFHFGRGSITLWLLGGVFLPYDSERLPAQMDALERWCYIAMIAAGPAAHALVSLGASLLAILLPSALLQQIALVNLLLMGWNLLPVPPLDGEKIVVSWGLFFWRRSQIYLALTVGLALSSISCVVVLLLWDGSMQSPFASVLPIVMAVWPVLWAGAFNAARLRRQSDETFTEAYLHAVRQERVFGQQRRHGVAGESPHLG